MDKDTLNRQYGKFTPQETAAYIAREIERHVPEWIMDREQGAVGFSLLRDGKGHCIQFLSASGKYEVTVRVIPREAERRRPFVIPAVLALILGFFFGWVLKDLGGPFWPIIPAGILFGIGAAFVTRPKP